jgi:hypothetical protein
MMFSEENPKLSMKHIEFKTSKMILMYTFGNQKYTETAV